MWDHEVDGAEPQPAGERGSAPLELVLLAPALVLLVVFVLWAGRSGRANLVTDLAAGEAAVVASLCCEDGDDQDAQEARETVVEQVLAARPGLDLWCIGGAQPGTGGNADEYVDEAWLESFEPSLPDGAAGVGAIGVSLTCETDGAVAPLRHIFPTVSFTGRATEVIPIPPAPRLSLDGYAAEEGHTGDDVKFIFKMEFSAATKQRVKIYYWTSVDSRQGARAAAAGTDFISIPEANPLELNAPAGTNSATFEVEIEEDDLYEYDETFLFHWRIEPSDPCAPDAPTIPPQYRMTLDAEIECTLGHPDYGKPVHPTTRAVDLDFWKAKPATGTILNDDPKPKLTVSSANAIEGNKLDFTVQLDAATAVGVEFTVQTKDDTATAPADYTSLVPYDDDISPNSTQAPSPITISVNTVDDILGEGDETFFLEIKPKSETIDGIDVVHVTLDNPPAAQGIGTIQDNDPEFTITDASLDEDQGSMVFTIDPTRAPPTGQSATVDWATVGPTAGYAKADGGASCGSIPMPDYEDSTTPTTLTFTTSASQTVSVPICDDALDEPQNEYFGVQLSNASSNASIKDGYGLGRIIDDDGPPVLSITGPATPVVEGDSMDFTVTLSKATTKNVQVTYAVTGLTATGPGTAPGDDFNMNSPASQSGTLTFQPSDPLSKTITVDSLTDTVSPEVDETFTVDLTNPVLNATLDPNASTATGTIIDDEKIKVSIGDASALEGGVLDFNVTLSKAVNLGVDVTYSTGLGTATPDTQSQQYDYAPVSNATLTIPANQTSGTISIQSHTDNLNEVRDETFLVELTNTSHSKFLFDDRIGLGTIKNVFHRALCLDDAATVTEGQALVFDARLGDFDSQTNDCVTGTGKETVTSEYDTRDGTADAPADYIAIVDGALSFLPAEYLKTISVATNNDQLYTEGDEHLFVDLDTATVKNAIIKDAIAKGEIEDSPRATISVNDASADEGNDLTFTVSAANLPATGNVTVDYTAAGLTATGPGTATGDDFDMKSPTTATGTLTLSSTQTTATITLTTAKGDAYEPDETLRIDLSNPSANAVLSDATGIGTIRQECVTQTDTTQPPPAFQFESGQLTGLPHALGTATEGQKMYFAFTINAPFCSGTQHFKLSVADVTTDSSDFTKPSTTQGYQLGGSSGTSHLVGSPGTACPGAVTKALQTIICLDITDDAVDELDETFTMEVNWLDTGTNAMPSHYRGLTGVTDTGTITDNDPLPNVSVSDVVVAEGSSAVFTVTMDRASSRAVTLSYATAVTGTGVGHAIQGTDYTQTSGTLTLAAGTTSATVTVPTTTDNNNEQNETFDLVLTLSSTNTAVLADGTGTGTIVDSALPFLTISDVTVLEDVGNADFTVTMSQTSSSVVRVAYRTKQLSTGDYATAGSDYTAKQGWLDINIGDPSGTISVPIIDDTLTEKAEDFHVELHTPTGAVIGDATGVGTIIDNDTACIDPTDLTATPPTLTVADASTTEAANNLAFTVTLSEPFCSDTSLSVATSDGTATAGVDYVSWSATVTVPAFYTQLTWGIGVVDDSLVENDETLNLTIEWASSMPAQYRALPDVTAVGTITDDDGNLKVSVANDPSGDEGTTLDFIVSLDKPGGRDVTVRYTTRDCSTSGCATAGSDYTAVSGTATIPEGQLTAVVPVLTITDTATEGDETFQFVLSDPVGGQVDDAIGVGTISDAAQPQISVDDQTTAEGGVLEFNVTLDTAGTSAVSVNYTTKDLTATAGQDYTAVSGTLVFSPGETTKKVQVATTADGIDEGDETFQLELSSPANASLADAVGLGTITNSAAPRLRVSDLAVTEGSTLSFEVILDKAATWNVVVSFATADCSTSNCATAGTDYTATSNTVTISPGDISARIPVVTIDDRLDENAETMRLTLSAPTGAVLADAIAIGTLFDNDAPPTVSLSAAAATADEDAGPLAFILQLSQASGRDVEVAYTTDDITATAGSDYTDNDGTATISAGQTSMQIEVALIDDSADEGTETLRFTLTSTGGYPKNATLGAITTAVGTIIDDDSTNPSISIRAPSPVVEGSAASVEVYLDRNPTQVVTLYYSTADGTATGGASGCTTCDYTSANNAQLTFAPGKPSDPPPSQTIDVDTVDDAEVEQTETFTLTLSNVTNGQLVDTSTTVSIVDNDGTPEVSIDDAASVTEGASAGFAVRLSAASNQAVTVDYATRADPTAGERAAVPGVDFTPTSGTLTIPAGQTTQTITVPTTQDVFDEANETFWVQLSTPSGAKVVDGTAEGLILDDDPVPSLSIDDATATEANPVLFTVRLDAASGRDVTATFATAKHNAGSDPADPGIDYVSAPGTLLIPAGSREATIQIATIDDTIAEHDESFLVKIENPVNALIKDGTALGLILDDEGLPRLSVADLEVFEDKGPAKLTVSLTRTSSDAITVGYRTVDGTATVPDPDNNDLGDYTFTSGTLTIATGETSGTIDVPLVNDDQKETDETFRLQLVSPVNATISDQEAVVTIRDDDGDPRISVGDVEVDENDAGGTIDFPVTLSHASTTDITVGYTTFDRTATQPADYTAASGTLTIPAGDTTAAISVTIHDDNIAEGTATWVQEPAVCPPEWVGTPECELHLKYPPPPTYENVGGETLLLRLDTPTAAVLDDAEAVGTIDDDEGLPRLSDANWDAEANEDDGHIVFQPTLSHPSAHTVTASYYFNVLYNAPQQVNNLDIDVIDTTGGQVVFPPGATSASIQVPVVDNSFASQNTGINPDPLNATFEIKLNARENAKGGGWPSARGDVWDDEVRAYVTSVAGKDVLESAGEAVFEVSLNRLTSRAKVVSYSTSAASTATGGSAGCTACDYENTSGNLTFPAGTANATISVPIVDDDVDESSESIILTASQQATVWIIDDDDLPELSIDDAQAAEASKKLGFLVSLSRESANDITVDYATADGTATQPGDYTQTTGTLTIDAGDTSASIEVPIVDDKVDESQESFTLSLSNATNATIGDAQANGIILDGDSLPTLTVYDASTTEITSSTKNHIYFEMSLDKESAVPVTFEARAVAVPSLGDYAATPNIDFDPVPYRGTCLNWANRCPNATWKRFTYNANSTSRLGFGGFEVFGDLVPERDERFRLELRNPVNASLASNQVWGIILNDDLPIVTMSDITVTEDATSAVLNLRLHDEGLDPASVKYRTKVLTTRDHPAAPGSDYTHTEGTLRIDEGDTTATITLPLIPDDTDEFDEVFLLELYDPVNLKLNDTSAVITITDDDDGYQIFDHFADEGSRLRLTVRRDDATSAETLSYTIQETADGATGGTHCGTGVDYITPDGTLTFYANQPSSSIDVDTCNDTETEGDEIFLIKLTATGRKTTGTATINKSD